MKDELGKRMKEQYEHRTRFFVPRRTYTLIRLDGKAFHTYTRGLVKPFDYGLSSDIDNAIIAMLPHIQGAVFAYTQSDEISVLVTDFALPTTSAWFDGNIQKMASVSSSIITAEFNRLRMLRNRPLKCPPLDGSKRPYLSEVPMAYFDSRVFTIPDRTEVMNYFIWRNQDCARNAVSMVAQSEFSHKELQGKSTAQMQEMLMTQKGINWSTYDEASKNGRLIVKESYVLDFKYIGITIIDKDFGDNTIRGSIDGTGTIRTRWVSKPAWKFTQNKEQLMNMIPKYE